MNTRSRILIALAVLLLMGATFGYIVTGRQYRVSCASMDGGLPTMIGVPMDGGSTSQLDGGQGKVVKGTTFYIAPCTSGSANCAGTNKIRVGYGASLTKDTGFEVGASGRDGAGKQVDAAMTADPRCISEGAAQQADVEVGSQVP